jgi:heat shock protein HspQ
VAERNLEPDEALEPIDHPLLWHFFDGFQEGRYVTDRRVN